MHIHSMVIDGFKSYGQRTEINGFDSQFNAITGLNGSGKSNILDAICFLLGITNLSHVRATNLQELVYKNGQAGITKASVSVSFTNKDKGQSPLGYEQYDEIVITRQVVIGGKNKYLINGNNIQNNRVNDLFRSVQLNINNPHFLIMQGRITKVLNMKPHEILSMIEEAAGTRMYESKKQQAQKTIEKKDAKLHEIENILNEEIHPTLAKLKQERNTYLEFQKIQRELEHLTKFYIAYKFLMAEETDSKFQEELISITEKLNLLQLEFQKGIVSIKNIDEHISKLQVQRDKELGGLLDKYEIECKEKENEALQAESFFKSQCESIKQEEKMICQIQKEMSSDQRILSEKKEVFQNLAKLYENLRDEDQKASDNLKKAQNRFEDISLGKFRSSEDGEEFSTTLQEQIIKIKSNISKAQTDIKTMNMKYKHNQETIKRLEKEIEKTESDVKEDSLNIQAFEKNVIKARESLNQLNYNVGDYESVFDSHRSLQSELIRKRNEFNEMSAKYPWLDFNFKDPEPNFDRSLVIGVVAKLFKVKDAKFCIALDTVAGGRLANVVVKNSVAAGKILKNGQLYRRTVMIPLDKISSSSISTNVLSFAQSIVGKENVFRALDLLSFEPHLKEAMKYIFGNALVVKDVETANKLAFHPKVLKTCVTFEGDKVMPSGDMSGGSAHRSGSTLTQVMALFNVQSTLELKEKEFDELEKQLKSCYDKSREFGKLKQVFEKANHELTMINERLKSSSHALLRQELEEYKAESSCLSDKILTAEKKEKDSLNQVKELEFKIKNVKNLKEYELKDAENEILKCKEIEREAKAKWSNKETEEDSLRLEISELEKSIAEALLVLENKKGLIEERQESLSQLSEKAKALRLQVKTCKESVRVQKNLMSANNAEINAENAKKEKLKKNNIDKELEIQGLEHKISKAKDDAKEANKTLEMMLQKYEWISEDRRFFGKPNTAYDFSSTDPKESARKISKLEETKDKLSKTVNMRAMKMLGRAEEQFSDLMRKKTTVETDKSKIYKVIEELDIKKKAELRNAWEKVNRDFGSIFSSLLPGANAQLNPPEGQDVLDGLEVKVSFGDVWKDSLSELSGGQRSLVALSLILALLLFKPAPLYILDEVDAALDLSHTQNIGSMLKTHFKHSQFIVVSLKDGMFNNANVLFKTKFVDGMSTVSRTTSAQKK